MLPHGPSPQPRQLTGQEAQNLSDLRGETGVDSARLAQAFSSWYSRAREIWRSLASSTDTTDEHKFRWEPATGRIAAGQQGATRISADLRAMSCRAQEIAALVKKGFATTDGRVEALCLRNRKAAGCKHIADSGVNASGLLGWCKEVEKAATAADHGRICAIRKVLDKKAAKIEDDDSRERAVEWRNTMTRGGNGKRPVHGKMLSRLAYRWVKGLAGWDHAKLIKENDQDSIPELQPGDKPYDEHASCTTRQPNGDAASAPASDQASVDQTAEMWADLWDSKGEYEEIDISDADSHELPKLTPAYFALWLRRSLSTQASAPTTSRLEP